jgi:hypothetical protein
MHACDTRRYELGSYQPPGFRGIALDVTSGHAALTAVTHTLRSKTLFAPGADWFQMSTPELLGTPTESCTGGLPTATLPLILEFVAGGNTTMPFVLPTAVFSSTTLLLPETIPMP